MGKWEKYAKKYRKEWEELPNFQGWLQVDTDDGDRAFCKVCRTSLRAHKTDLLDHTKRKKHIRNFNRMKPCSSQMKLTNVVTITNETKEVELKIAAYIAIHANIKNVDHLTELMQILFRNVSNKSSIIENIRLHRTKCTMLIKNTIGEAFKVELVEDIGSASYSLLIDESTDVAVFKYMCLCVRYYSETYNKIVTDFLGLIQIVQATAVILAETIEDFLKQIGLDIEKLIGLGTDGANNLCGKHHSVYTILKEKCPRLQLVKCVAHSLHLCCSKAADALPSSVDFICKETYNWFAHSTIRRDEYKKIFDLINTNETNVKFLKFMQLSETRWLARANVMKIILEQWTEIKAYFSAILNVNKNYMIRLLHEMLNDNSLYIYFTVVQTVIMNVNVVSGLFQHDNADIFKIYCELYQLLLNNLYIVVKPIFLEGLQNMSEYNLTKIVDILNNDLSYIAINTIDFGFKYREALRMCGNMDGDSLNVIKTRCRDFVLTLCLELANRIPTNIKLFNSIKYFSIENCLNKVNRPKLESLPLHLLEKSVDEQVIESQWNNLIQIDWPVSESTSSETFWFSMVRSYKNAGGVTIFEELSASSP